MALLDIDPGRDQLRRPPGPERGRHSTSSGGTSPGSSGRTAPARRRCSTSSPGCCRPGRGQVVLDGVDITRKRPHQRARLGIGRTFQRLETFGTLSARENILVAAEMRRGWSHDQLVAQDGDRRDPRAGRPRRASPTSGSTSSHRHRPPRGARPGAGHPAASAAARRAVGRPQRRRDRPRSDRSCRSWRPPTSRCCSSSTTWRSSWGRASGSTCSTSAGSSPPVRPRRCRPTRRCAPPTSATTTTRPTAPAPRPSASSMPDGKTAAVPDGRPAALELRDIRAGYGPIDVLHGVSLIAPGRLGVRPARPERCREVDDAEGRERADRPVGRRRCCSTARR